MAASPSTAKMVGGMPVRSSIRASLSFNASGSRNESRASFNGFMGYFYRKNRLT
jgi:hypothetical protein